MKVDASNNYRLTSITAPKNLKQNPNQQKVSSVSFKGKGRSIGDMITDSLHHKNILKKLKGLEWLKGESGGILITAIGTGCVAPWFIAFNPFVKAPKGASEEEKKEVKNTKMYTAMRQIVSMFLAIVCQLGLLKPIDKLWNQMINKKEYAAKFRFNIDQSELNTKSFIEEKVKKDFKAKGIKKPSFTEIFKDGWKSYKEKNNAYKAKVKAEVSKIQDSQLEKVATVFGETGEMKTANGALDHKSMAELLNKQIDDYIKDAETLKIDDKGMKFYSERAEVLIKNKQKLKEILEKAPDDKTQLKRYLENLIKDEKNSDIKDVLKEILERPEDIQKSRIQRTVERIKNIEQMCNGSYSKEAYMNAMKERNNALDTIITNLQNKKLAKEELNNVSKEKIQKTVKDLIETCKFDQNNSLLKSILHDTDTFNFDEAKLTKKIHKDATKLYKKLIENNYKSVNQISKVIVGVFITLPITCNLLNWIYPRFMEICFPKLAGVKKAEKGGNK